MNIEEFSSSFAEIASRGFVKSQRKGDTGVGYTLETLLGIAENNIALADMKCAELKAHRSGSSSMITLFTSDRKAWKIAKKDAIVRYGHVDAGVQSLYLTASTKPTPAAVLKVGVDCTNVSLLARDNTLVAQWSLTNLTQRFDLKIPALMVVSVDSEIRNDVEYLHYKSATLYTSPTVVNFKAGIESGDVKVDLRLKLKPNGKVRNHGTGFRVHEQDLPKLFSTSSPQVT